MTCDTFRGKPGNALDTNFTSSNAVCSLRTGNRCHRSALAYKKSECTPNWSTGFFYVAMFEEAIYVLHAFEKKTRKTAGYDLELARSRLSELLQTRRRKRI
jgi:hypothetical protein